MVVVGVRLLILLILLGLLCGGGEFIVSREGFIAGREGFIASGFGPAGGARVSFRVRGDLRFPSTAADAAEGRLPRRGFFRPDMAILDV